MSAPIKLALCGDVMLGRLINENIPRLGYAYPWGDLLPLLTASDLFLINHEFTLTSHTGRWRNGAKAFYFRADPDVVRSLITAGVGFASLANNHIVDYERTGLLDTVAVLDRAGIAHAGAGADEDAARAPAIIECKGRRIGIVSFADHPPEWAATPERPGLNYTPISIHPPEFAPVEAAISTARDAADIVIFSIHWGPNMRVHPPASFQAFAHRVVDVGADLFWGHSAHVLQGIEVYRKRPILYDTGDFVDDYRVDPELRNDLTALFQIDISATGVERLTLIPATIGRMQVNRASGSDRTWIVSRLSELSRAFGTTLSETDDGQGMRVAI